MNLFDAHNHLHDPRLMPWRERLRGALASAGIAGAVVNGTCERDWPEVVRLAEEWPSGSFRLRPAFGVHPWFARQRSAQWERTLTGFLDAHPAASAGEIGLDGSLPDADPDDQEELLIRQLEIAAERNLPATIHCVRAWDRLLRALSRCAVPARGFLLHAWCGPPDMVPVLVGRGAYFSFGPAHFHSSRQAARSSFRHLPVDRILLETDAPNMPPPAELDVYGIAEAGSGRRLNHPASLATAAAGLAETLERTLPEIASLTAANWQRLFGADGREQAPADHPARM